MWGGPCQGVGGGGRTAGSRGGDRGWVRGRRTGAATAAGVLESGSVWQVLPCGVGVRESMPAQLTKTKFCNLFRLVD